MKAINQRIFIGGLDVNTTEQELGQHFSQFGDIDNIEIIIERKTGKSLKFDFQNFSI